MEADNGGLRYNAGKPPVHLIPQDALLELAKVYGKGAEKYEARNWERGMAWSACYASLLRHSFAFWSGQDVDEETALMHTAQMAWNAVALLTYQLRNIGVDDRHMLTTEHQRINDLLQMASRLGHNFIPKETRDKLASAMKEAAATGEGDVLEGITGIDPGPVKFWKNTADVRTETFGPLPKEPPTHTPTLPPERKLPPGSVVEIEKGLRFRSRDITDNDVWEVVVPFTSMGKFTARNVTRPEVKDQMMHLRAIGEVVLEEALEVQQIFVGTRVKLRGDPAIYEVLRKSDVKTGEESGFFHLYDTTAGEHCSEPIHFSRIELVLPPEKKSSYRCVLCPNDALHGSTLCGECVAT